MHRVMLSVSRLTFRGGEGLGNGSAPALQHVELLELNKSNSKACTGMREARTRNGSTRVL